MVDYRIVWAGGHKEVKSSLDYTNASSHALSYSAKANVDKVEIDFPNGVVHVFRDGKFNEDDSSLARPETPNRDKLTIQVISCDYWRVRIDQCGFSWLFDQPLLFDDKAKAERYARELSSILTAKIDFFSPDSVAMHTYQNGKVLP